MKQRVKQALAIADAPERDIKIGQLAIKNRFNIFWLDMAIESELTRAAAIPPAGRSVIRIVLGVIPIFFNILNP